MVSTILKKLGFIEEIKPFDKSLIPSVPQSLIVATPKVEEVTSLDKIVLCVDKNAVESDVSIDVLPMDISEAETRRLYIDLMLREAGWKILDTDGMIQPSRACIEVELHGIRTHMKSVMMIMCCLEAKYGVRPVIYYTNGFQTFIIDGLSYPPRRLYSFHTEEDLERLIQKRNRKDITDFSVNDNITYRYYQKTAIKAVCEHYNTKHRKGLLVMATETGKTRVAISLVDVLKRNDWVKNVLFLADRTSLVTQAKRRKISLIILPSSNKILCL